ncbi:hypothetical protein BC833DRAFT_620167 [Globomyces pollinis-pini]|nr:hypothetical protein BC833DRAFT_620167 [Globomyces pollinis-pini]KAJ2998076.1 hypothetical protein HDV02_004901 [Globomyces sp. JEL0801]
MNYNLSYFIAFFLSFLKVNSKIIAWKISNDYDSVLGCSNPSPICNDNTFSLQHTKPGSTIFLKLWDQVEPDNVILRTPNVQIKTISEPVQQIQNVANLMIDSTTEPFIGSFDLNSDIPPGRYSMFLDGFDLGTPFIVDPIGTNWITKVESQQIQIGNEVKTSGGPDWMMYAVTSVGFLAIGVVVGVFTTRRWMVPNKTNDYELTDSDFGDHI